MRSVLAVLVTKGPDGRPQENPAWRVLAGSNAQCEQCNHTHSDSQHCECYRIVVQPMQPLLHGAPPCSASCSKREGCRDNFSGRLEFRCSEKESDRGNAVRGNAVVPGPRHLICVGRLIVVDIWS